MPMAPSGGGRAASRSSGTSSDSDGDMWSVACTEDVVTPRADLAKSSRQGASNDERQRRRQKLYEHSHELLVWYSRRVGELEQENRELRCELAKSVRQRCVTEELDPAEARECPKTFTLHGADEDCEAQGDTTERSMGATASNIFDADWSKHSMQACRHRIEQRIHSLSNASQDSGGIPAEASPDTRSGEFIGANTPRRATAVEAAMLGHGCPASAAQDVLELERLLGRLQEPEARVIYQQFARFESETAYLRSVIRTYEDIYLDGADDGGGPAELPARPERRASYGRGRLGSSRVKPRHLSSDGIAGRLHVNSEKPPYLPGSTALSPLSRLRSFSNPPFSKPN